jgi:hypothetical protein
VRVLRRLKISEVSSVDRAANGSARVTLFKRDGAPDNGNDNDDEVTAALRFLLTTNRGASLLHRVFGANGASDIGDVERLAEFVAQVRASNSDEDEPSDPHHPWLGIGGDKTAKKVFPMDRDEVLKAAVRRDGGIVPLCKRICANGSGDISEQELTQLLTEHAQQLYPELSPSSAFAKLFTSAGAETLRRATAITKGLVAPVAVAGDSDSADDSGAAYEELQRLATGYRKRLPLLSSSQAFSRAAADRPDLLNRAVPRPGRY